MQKGQLPLGGWSNWSTPIIPLANNGGDQESTMANIGAVLKQEIVRLSRREAHSSLKATKRASSQYRRDIAMLKRQIADLSRQIAALKGITGAQPAQGVSESAGKKIRFVAKGLTSQRERLGLSAAALGRLIGVSAQAVYNWEGGKAVPRAEPMRKIVALRSVTKRMVQEHLAKVAG